MLTERRYKVFSGYIPTSNLLSSNGLSMIDDTSVASMKVQVYNLVGAPYEMNGVHEFEVQHNPERLESSKVLANYASKIGLGMTEEHNHYLNTTKSTVPFSFIIENTYSGPPHSRIDSTGSIVYQDFANLWEVDDWFRNLTTPVTDWKKPPYVRVSIGRYSVFGYIPEVSGTQWLRLYPNGEPMIARISFMVKPCGINSSRDSAFYEVGKT